MAKPQATTKQIDSILRELFTVQEEDISCDECYDVVDQYVDMLRAGKDVAAVLPKVKEHLAQCQCCEVEFKALIAILEAGSVENGSDPAKGER